MNFNPALLSYGDSAIMAYEYRGNSHCVYSYLLNPDTNSSTIYQDGFANCPEQTSTAPSLAQYNSEVYLGFGSNDSGRSFDVRFTYQNSLYFYYRHSFPQGMNGSPNLLAIPPSNTNPRTILANFYIWNGQLRYMYGQ